MPPAQMGACSHISKFTFNSSWMNYMLWFPIKCIIVATGRKWVEKQGIGKSRCQLKWAVTGWSRVVVVRIKTSENAQKYFGHKAKTQQWFAYGPREGKRPTKHFAEETHCIL